MDQTLLRVATKEREEIRGHNQIEDGKMKEGTTWNRKAIDKRQSNIQSIYGGLHRAVDGQNLGKIGGR